jgi:hypothetical protein
MFTDGLNLSACSLPHSMNEGWWATYGAWHTRLPASAFLGTSSDQWMVGPLIQ